LDDVSQDRISIFPNPAKEIIHIDGVGQGWEFVVTNVQGQVVLQGALMSENLDVSGLTTGIFILNLKDQQGQVELTKKIVVSSK
jgi:hypothetical protein